jgi:hypothetical protein
MQDAQTYRSYADDCMKLALSMPHHRDKLVEMAAVWRRLADAAEKRGGKEKPAQA